MGEEGKIVESRVNDLERYRVLGSRAAQSPSNGVQFATTRRLFFDRERHT
jgi:hypothetical protein